MLNAARTFTAWTIASFLGSGFFPIAPGTAGSLAAIPLAWFCWSHSLHLGVLVFTFLFFAGVWSANEIVNITKTEDNQRIVIDEVLGILITSSVAPLNFKSYFCVFIFFRIADIFKPFPARWIDQNIPGGLGVIMDDIAAALWSATAIYFIGPYL